MKEKIKIFLQQNWFKAIMLTIIMVIAGSTFYWFQWRPSQIRKECGIKVSKTATESHLSPSEALTLLNFCLKKNGLEK